MKNILYKLKIVAVAVLTLSLGSCEAILDDEIKDYGDTPVLVQFSETEITANFIQTDASPVYTYDIPVTLIGARNQPIDRPVDVTVGIASSSTATEGVEFNLVDSNVTIPAGEMTADVQIEVLSDNLDPFDPKTLVLEIVSSSEVISETDDTNVVLQAACEYNLEGFYGTYDALEDGQFEYVVVVEEGPAPNTLLVHNLYETNGETVIELSEDPTAPYITYRSEEFSAVLYVNATYGDLWATTSTPTASSYGSCDNSMSLVFKRCVGAGCFAGTVSIELTKQDDTPAAE